MLSHLRAPTKGPQVGLLGEGAAAPGLRCCSHWVSRPQGRRCGPQLLHSPRAAGHLTTRHASDLVSWCVAFGAWPTWLAASRSITSCARSPTPEQEEGGSLGGGRFSHTSPPKTYTCLIRGIQRGGSHPQIGQIRYGGPRQRGPLPFLYSCSPSSYGSCIPGEARMHQSCHLLTLSCRSRHPRSSISLSRGSSVAAQPAISTCALVAAGQAQPTPVRTPGGRSQVLLALPSPSTAAGASASGSPPGRASNSAVLSRPPLAAPSVIPS